MLNRKVESFIRLSFCFHQNITNALSESNIINSNTIHPVSLFEVGYLNWKREGAGPSSNLLTQAQNLRNRFAGSLGLKVLELVGLLR